MLKLTINGTAKQLDVDETMPLLWVLRDELHYTGTKYGCGIGQCGACTVHINGKPQRSCLMPIGSVKNAEITTIEGLDDDVGKAVKSAWKTLDVPQCGYCQSGQMMSAAGLLKDNPAPNNSEIDQAMSGNICRCATYEKIREAIQTASKKIDIKEVETKEG